MQNLGLSVFFNALLKLTVETMPLLECCFAVFPTKKSVINLQVHVIFDVPVFFFILFPVPSAAAGIAANTVIPHQTVPPAAVPLHLKDDRPHHSSPGSPVIFPQQTALKDASPQLPGSQHPTLCSTAPSQASSSPLSHSSNASSPVPVSQPPAVNLQSLSKYVDKNLAFHVCNWPTDLMDRQVRVQNII